MNDLTLDALRARERNLEEEWISKYRAALLAVPNHETWEDRLHRIAGKVYGTVAASAQEVKARALSNRFVARWMHAFASSSLRTAKNPHPHFPVVRTVRATAPKKNHPVRVRAQSTKKAG